MSPGSSRLLKRNCGPEPEALRMEEGRARGVGSSTATPPFVAGVVGELVPSVSGVVGVSGCAKIRAGGGVFGRIAIGDRLFGLRRIVHALHTDAQFADTLLFSFYTVNLIAQTRPFAICCRMWPVRCVSLPERVTGRGNPSISFNHNGCEPFTVGILLRMSRSSFVLS